MTKKCGTKNFPAIVVGILFTVSGLMKLFMMTPEGFAQNMLVPVLGVSAGLALILSWLIIIVEVLGGIALLTKCKCSHGLYKVLVAGLIIILSMAIIFAHLMGQDYMSALKDLVIIAVLISSVSSCCGGTCEMKKDN